MYVENKLLILKVKIGIKNIKFIGFKILVNALKEMLHIKKNNLSMEYIKDYVNKILYLKRI
jgi:hypothetical protein